MSEWRPFAGLSRHVAPDGTAFLTAGEGRPLLLIHGVGMNAEAMAPQIDHFSRGWRVFAIDMPGHGETPLLPGQPALGDYIRHAADFLWDTAGEPALVVGHSMGALVAVGLGLDAPELCWGIVALNAVYCRTPEASKAVWARAAEIADPSSPADLEGPLRRWFGEDAGREALQAQVRQWLEAVPRAGYAAAYGVFAASDRAHEGRMAQLRVPALFLTGEFDANSTPEMSQRMAHEAPQRRAVVLDGCRHNMAL